MDFLYKQIYDDYLEKIINKELEVGSKLPSEKEISQLYQVSRITSKRAIEELANNGFVERTRGKGTFVIGWKDVQINSETETSESFPNNKIIAVIIPTQTVEGDAMKLINGISSTLAKANYSMQLYLGVSDIKSMTKIIEKEYEEQIAGIIINPPNQHEGYQLFTKLRNNNFPIVSYDKHFSEIPLDSVTCKNKLSGKEATNYLISLNHKKIAFVSDLLLEQASTVRERFLGYCEALKENGITYTDDYVFIKKDTMEHQRAYDETFYKNTLINFKKNGGTAIFCLNDIIASYLIQSALSLGYNIPKDFSLIGFDNSFISIFQKIPITTIEQDFFKMGQETANLILKKIKNPNLPLTHIYIQTKLIERNSCAKLDEEPEV